MNPQQPDPNGIWQPQPQQTPPQPPTQAPPSAQQPLQPGVQQPIQDYSVDYLDQISTPLKPQKTANHKLILIIMVLLGLLVLVGVAALLLSSRPSTLDKASELSARMESLVEISKDQHSYLRDNDLRSDNTAYTIFLTNAIADLEAPLEAAGIEKDVTASIEAAESAHSSELTSEFDDARLNVVLDRTYAREMTYQIEVLQTMMRQVYDGTDNEELRTFLDNAYRNLTPIAESFDEFAGA